MSLGIARFGFIAEIVLYHRLAISGLKFDSTELVSLFIPDFFMPGMAVDATKLFAVIDCFVFLLSLE